MTENKNKEQAVGMYEDICKRISWIKIIVYNLNAVGYVTSYLLSKRYGLLEQQIVLD